MTTIDMGMATVVGTQGCVVVVDGVQIDVWSAKSATARAGWQVWSLSFEQVTQLKGDIAAGFTRQDHPMRGFHR